MALYRLTANASFVIRESDGALIPNDPRNVDRAVYQLWLSTGGIPDPYIPPSGAVLSTVPPVLVAAAFNINVADGDITDIDGMFNILGGAYMDVGTYLLFFTTSQPDTNYFAIISGNAPVKTMTDQETDYFQIETKGFVGGAHIDSPQTSVQIYRIAS